MPKTKSPLWGFVTILERDDGALADQDESRWDGADHTEVLLGTLDVDAMLEAQDQEERGTAPSLVT
jgi:hypothetical protein